MGDWRAQLSPFPLNPDAIEGGPQHAIRVLLADQDCPDLARSGNIGAFCAREGVEMCLKLRIGVGGLDTRQLRVVVRLPIALG